MIIFIVSYINTITVSFIIVVNFMIIITIIIITAIIIITTTITSLSHSQQHPPPPLSYRQFLLTRERRSREFLKARSYHLGRWFVTHFTHPYPSKEQKDQLASRTNMTRNQVKECRVGCVFGSYCT